MKNVFADLSEIQSTGLAEELVDVLASAPAARVERIVSQGHRSPSNFWYDQDEDEWVIVLRGRATLTLQADADESYDDAGQPDGSGWPISTVLPENTVQPENTDEPAGRRRQVELGPGDHLMIPAHCRHRVDRTSLDEPTLWLAVFFSRESNA